MDNNRCNRPASRLLAGLDCEGATPTGKRVTSPGSLNNSTASQIEESTDARPVAPGAKGPSVVRAQILLDRARFSPGEIDGQYGEDLAIAIKGYQENRGATPTGIVDAETWKLLNQDTAPLLSTYTITPADVKGPFLPIPKDARERAKMKWLGYESPQEGLGEKFHVSPKFLEELNPGKRLATAGAQIIVPNVRRVTAGIAWRVIVSKSKRVVTAYGARNKVLGQYPATIGGPHDPLPIGSWRIVGVQRYPWFYYQPERFWNANPNEATAKLPPGPRNPAGVVWMGLSKPHYGIHGAPEPGHVHHNESYGCIRLTNWDVLDLAHMVRAGTPAILEE